MQPKGFCLLSWSKKTETFNKERRHWGKKNLIVLEFWLIHSGQVRILKTVILPLILEVLPH